MHPTTLVVLLLATVYGQSWIGDPTSEPTIKEPTPRLRDLETRTPTGKTSSPTTAIPTRPTLPPTAEPSITPTMPTAAPTCSNQHGCEINFCAHGDDEIWLDMTFDPTSSQWNSLISSSGWHPPIDYTYCEDLTCDQIFRFTIRENRYLKLYLQDTFLW